METKKALEGVRVADFGWVWAAPYCTSLLGYLGERSNAAFGTQSAAVLPSLAPHGVGRGCE